MDAQRSTFASDPRLFGRRSVPPSISVDESNSASIGKDVRLFAMTFAAGFLFMSVFLA